MTVAATDQTSAMTDAELAPRLRSLVLMDTALAAGGGIFTVLISLTVARIALLTALGVVVLGVAAVIASAVRPLERHDLGAAVRRLAGANWVIAVLAAFVATFAWPLLMITALLPMTIAAPFVSRNEVRPYVIVSFLTAMAVACLGLLQDATGLSDELEEWVRDLTLLVVGPALTAFVVWAVLQSNVRLQTALDGELRARRDLAKQADELKASRRRVVAATDRERRRIERDLHDGAQSRLIAVNLGLARLRSTLAAEPQEALNIVEEIRSEVQLAHVELRDLARGVYPTVLTQHGLVAAIDAAVDRSAVDVRLALEPVGRHSAEIEAAVYFCILEALKNANHHASASVIAVRVDVADGHLRFEVADDGTGFDERSSTGVGMDNMADRLGSVGGSLRVSSHRSRGTAVSGTVPLEL